MKAKKNDNVKVHYKGTFPDGEVFDSSEGREPLAFTVGAGQMIAGFDQAVEGMEVNEKKKVEIAAADAYGERNDQMIQQVPRENLPADMKPEVGQTLTASSPEGHQTQVVVTDVSDAHITIDANHPLAGRDLVFEIELVEIG